MAPLSATLGMGGPLWGCCSAGQRIRKLTGWFPLVVGDCDLVVLARYMQIPPGTSSSAWARR